MSRRAPSRPLSHATPLQIGLALTAALLADPILPAGPVRGPEARLSAQETGTGGVDQQQSKTTLQEATRVKLEDGTTLYGVLIRQTEEVLELRLASGGSVVLDREAIAEIQIVQGVMKNGAFLPPDPNQSRLFWGPTARTLPKGRGYFGVYEVVVPFLTVGVTDWLMIGGGTPLLFSSADGISAIWLTPKIRLLHREKLDVAAGSFLLFEADGDDSFGAIHYMVMTAGDERASLTVGGGIFQGSLDAPGAIMLGGQVRASRSVKLMAEGYLAGGDALVIAGPRFLGQKLSADVGLGVPLTGDGFFVLPVVNFAYAW